MALTLNMKPGHKIECTGPVTIECAEVHGGWTHLKFHAPTSTRIFRLDENGQVKGAQTKKLDIESKKPQIK
jgi:sRNA-binding carbon storage regulator CsrA